MQAIFFAKIVTLPFIISFVKKGRNVRCLIFVKSIVIEVALLYTVHLFHILLAKFRVKFS